MEQAPDRKRVQEFARRLFGHYTSGMLTLMVDIGHRTGLFEAAANGVGTSQQIGIAPVSTSDTSASGSAPWRQAASSSTTLGPRPSSCRPSMRSV